MNIAVCDNEKEVRELLITQIKKQLEPLRFVYHIYQFQMPSELFSDIKKEEHKFDLIFMELEFYNPVEDGIIWAKKIHEVYPDVLLNILTSYEERFKEGYMVRAFRFMTKPLDNMEIREALFAAIKQLQVEQRIYITTNGTTKKITGQQILYLVAQSGGSDIHTIKDIYFKEKSLLYWEEIFSTSSFFRIHKKYLVNLHHVKEISNHAVILTNNERLPVSRRKWTALREAYRKWGV